jgi:hypothetical protein
MSLLVEIHFLRKPGREGGSYVFAGTRVKRISTA